MTEYTETGPLQQNCKKEKDDFWTAAAGSEHMCEHVRYERVHK